MTLSLNDFLLPVCMALMFGIYRYTFYMRADPDTAVVKSVSDAAKGTAGLLALTLLYKFILPQ